MTKLNWITVFTLLTNLFLNQVSTAQVNKNSTGVSFTAISLTNLTNDNIYVRDGKKFIKIEVNNTKRSKSYKFVHAESFELFTESDDPDVPYKLIGKAPFKPGAKKMLYFLSQSQSTAPEDLPITIFGVDDSQTTFSKSSFRFINFTNIPLVIDFNKKKVLMQPKDIKIAKLALTQDGEWTPFIVKNKQGKIFGGTRLFSHSENREMVLIFPPKKGKKRLDLRYFSD